MLMGEDEAALSAGLGVVPRAVLTDPGVPKPAVLLLCAAEGALFSALSLDDVVVPAL
jgi:hypothetical protein